MADPVLVLHFTQGGSIAGAVAAMRSARSECHEVVDPSSWQPDGRATTLALLPWTTPARSLKHPAGMPDTNNRGWHAGTSYGRVYQVEIVGYSEQAAAYPDDWYQRLGDYLRDRCARLGVPYRFPCPFVGNKGYGATAPQRLTWAQWATVAGIVGHQHVPGNAHWDPGALDITRLTHGDTVPTTDAVKASQQRLNDSGAKPPLVIDGVWGPACDAALDAVLKFQQGQMADLRKANATSADTIKRLTDARVADAKLIDQITRDRDDYQAGARAEADLADQLKVERDTAVANREAAEAEAAKLRLELQTGGRMPQLLADLDAAIAKARA